MSDPAQPISPITIGELADAVRAQRRKENIKPSPHKDEDLMCWHDDPMLVPQIAKHLASFSSVFIPSCHAF